MPILLLCTEVLPLYLVGLALAILEMAALTPSNMGEAFNRSHLCSPSTTKTWPRKPNIVISKHPASGSFWQSSSSGLDLPWPRKKGPGAS